MADYAYWENALAGTFGPVHESEVHPGFWRKRVRSGGPYIPVAIWPDETGTLIALVDGQQVDPLSVWTYCCRNPVTHAAYVARTETGRWPDEAPELAGAEDNPFGLPALGHNHPPQDEADILRGQIEAAAAGAANYADITDPTHMAQAQSLRARLNELARDADTKREAEKRPHFDAAKAVDLKWQPMVKAAKAAADAIGKALSVFLTRQAREADEARRAAEREAAKAAAANRPAPVPPPEPVVPAKVRGAYGRAASVRVVKVASVTDQDAAYGFLKREPEIVALIAKLAQRAVDAEQPIPGVHIEIQRKVA